MTFPASVRRAVALCALLVACVSPAMAQGPSGASKTYYVGTLAPEGEPASPLALDLTVYDDGFAFARLQLLRRHEVLFGTGRLVEGQRLRLRFRRPAVDEDPWWAAEVAHLTYLGTVEPEPSTEAVAVLAADREYGFLGEGASLTGILRLASGEPAALTARRLASTARWSFEQGRVAAAVELPRFPGRAVINDWLSGSAMPAMLRFIDEGLGLDDGGQLGWAWWQEERVDLAGAAGAYLSLLSTVDTYTGGAHPNSFSSSHLLEVRERVVLPLGLSDAFAGRGWVEELSDLVLAGLEAQEAAWVVDGDVTSLTEDDLATFTLDATGVTFHFSPYMMGPYVQGTFRVTLPYDAVVHLAAEDGPLELFAAGSRSLLPLPR